MSEAVAPPVGVEPTPGLKRVLNLRDLTVFGVMMMFPLAPAAVYGAVTVASQGHMALAYVVAFVAMAFTALSYGAMAGAYPRAGSTYTYTRHGLNQYLGLLSGWAIALDYVLFPTLNAIIVGIFANQLVPQVDYWVWVVGFLAFMTFFNLREVRWLARVSYVLLAISLIVIAYFVIAAIGALNGGTGAGTALSITPFYDASSFSFDAVIAGTAIACFSFLGFDAVSTLGEETKNPGRNLSTAMLLALVFITFLLVIQAYFGQLLVPDWTTLPGDGTDYFVIFEAAGGATAATIMSLAVIAASLANGTDAAGGAARLLFGMGRDGVIPRQPFGYLWSRTQTPVLNVLLVTVLTFVLATQGLNTIIEIINFGALIAFFLVNLSVIGNFFVRAKRRDAKGVLRYLVAPLVGAAVIAWLWLNLASVSWIWSGALPEDLALLLPMGWLVLGILYTLFTTSFLRKPLPEFKEAHV
jgi:putrescine importer